MTPRNIASTLKDIGWSLTKTAREFGVHWNTPYHWVTGRRKPGGASLLLLLALRKAAANGRTIDSLSDIIETDAEAGSMR